jgi:hypothetical protein
MIGSTTARAYLRRLRCRFEVRMVRGFDRRAGLKTGPYVPTPSVFRPASPSTDSLAVAECPSRIDPQRACGGRNTRDE